MGIGAGTVGDGSGEGVFGAGVVLFGLLGLLGNGLGTLLGGGWGFGVEGAGSGSVLRGRFGFRGPGFGTFLGVAGTGTKSGIGMFGGMGPGSVAGLVGAGFVGATTLMRTNTPKELFTPLL